jgi:dTDP-4-dehydrorhamnose 3,5-epimerase|tara:strand:- start:4200 stop:4763 length:564 start_codon:yes stop_codon:yes gene_type:complete
MKLESTPISDLYVLQRKIIKDNRGSFSRLFGEDDILKAGRPTNIVHVNTSTSVEAGTLRGVHFQYPPFSEAKVVACTSGSIWDVGIDLRPDSPTRFQWYGEVLTPDNGKSMIVPEGFGHAFITLEPNSTAVYAISAYYNIEYESGALFNDPLLAIDWPIEPTVVSEKDRDWGLLEERIEELDKNFTL